MENTQYWILESLNINQDWQTKGHYCGNIKFKNGIKMDMTLRIGNDAAVKMIAILQEEIQKSAAHLSETLSKSMPIAIEAPKETL